MDGIHSLALEPTAVTGQRTHSVADRPSATPSSPRSEEKPPPARPSLEGQRRLVTDIDQAADRVVGVFVDEKTGEVVDQVPSEAMLRLLAKTRAMLGSLFDEKV